MTSRMNSECSQQHCAYCCAAQSDWILKRYISKCWPWRTAIQLIIWYMGMTNFWFVIFDSKKGDPCCLKELVLNACNWESEVYSEKVSSMPALLLIVSSLWPIQIWLLEVAEMDPSWTKAWSKWLIPTYVELRCLSDYGEALPKIAVLHYLHVFFLCIGCQIGIWSIMLCPSKVT